MSNTTIDDQLTSRRRHLYGFGAVVVLALLLVAMTVNAIHSSNARQTADGWRVHSLQVMLVTEQIRSAANEALRGERGYLLTRDPEFLKPYHHAVSTAPKLAARLRELTQDNPRQNTHVEMLDTQLTSYLAVLDRTLRLAREGRDAEALQNVKNGAERRGIEAVLGVVDSLETEERRLLAERDLASNVSATRSEIADYALAALSLLFLGIVAWAGVTASRARGRTLEMEQQLRHAITTDQLTGLLSRRAFMAALDVEFGRAARNGSPPAIALIDLDLFKSVNDRFGHAGGDQVLRRFAQIARETMRTTDIIGRLGGEEFAVLMPDTDQVQSGIAGERLRQAVAKRRIVLDSGALVPITISVGVAHGVPGEARDRLIARADEALYDAKESGRNRTRLAA